MARLSRISGRKANNTKSALRSRMVSRPMLNEVEDTTLLGHLFVTVDKTDIIDATGNHQPIISRTKMTDKNRALFGLGCVEFDGKDSNLNFTDDGDFNFGVEDFSIDWWEYKKSDPNDYKLELSPIQYSLYKNSVDRKDPINIFSNPNKVVSITSNGDNWDIADEKFIGSIEEDVWIHWALTRANNNFYTFKNGQIKNIWISELPVNSSNGFFTIGSSPKGNNFYGYMDKIRVVKGTALWTDEFLPNKEDLFY